MNALVFLLVAALQSPSTIRVEAIEDTYLVWDKVELQVSDTLLGDVRVRASLKAGKNSTFLNRLEIVTASGKVTCASSFYNDLPFPDLGSLKIWLQGDGFEKGSDFRLRFSFGQEPIAEERYPEVSILIGGQKCVSREFAVPTEDGGTQYQEIPPGPRE